MASLETTRGRQVPAWQQANRYYQQPVDYVNVRQPESTNVSTAPATRRRRTTNGNYTIQKGDTLSAIAKRYGTTVQAIAEANGITDVNRIYVGDSLNIPGNTQAKKPTTKSEAMQRSKGRIDTTIAVSRVPKTLRITDNPQTNSEQTVNQNTTWQNRVRRRMNLAQAVGKVPRTLSINQQNSSVDNDDRIYKPKRDLPQVSITAKRNLTPKQARERFHIPTYLPEVKVTASRTGFSQQDMQAIRRSQQKNPPVIYNGRSKSSLRRYQRY